MISDFVLNVIFFVVNLIVLLLSGLGDVSIPVDISNSITTVKPYYLSIEQFFPVSTVIAILAFEIIFEGVFLAYRAIKWAYQKIPFIN